MQRHVSRGEGVNYGMSMYCIGGGEGLRRGRAGDSALSAPSGASGAPVLLPAACARTLRVLRVAASRNCHDAVTTCTNVIKILRSISHLDWYERTIHW